MGKGHPVKGNNRKGQFRALYAKGILHSSGKGKGRRTSYNKGASGSVVGGKTAHLQSGGAKVDHSGTRAARIAAGRKLARADHVETAAGRSIARSVQDPRNISRAEHASSRLQGIKRGLSRVKGADGDLFDVARGIAENHSAAARRGLGPGENSRASKRDATKMLAFMNHGATGRRTRVTKRKP